MKVGRLSVLLGRNADASHVNITKNCTIDDVQENVPQIRDSGGKQPQQSTQSTGSTRYRLQIAVLLISSRCFRPATSSTFVNQSETRSCRASCLWASRYRFVVYASTKYQLFANDADSWFHVLPNLALQIARPNVSKPFAVPLTCTSFLHPFVPSIFPLYCDIHQNRHATQKSWAL